MTAAPERGRLPEEQVRAMFDRIAGVYDVMNRVMTAGLDARWRARAADLAAIGTGDRALDVACGTGDLAVELANRGAQVTGSDFSEEMLTRARAKQPAIEWQWADALALPYPDDAFDAVTVGFGARNFSELEPGIAEMRRVAKPGGRVVILEFTTPQKPPLSWFFQAWFDRAVPVLGHLARDPEAYAYLPDSVRRYPDPREVAATMASRGLHEVRWIVTAGGIVTLHRGVK